MTPEKAAQSLKRARDRLSRDNAANHERFRRSLYAIQEACEHDWKKSTDLYQNGIRGEWECAACGVVSDKNPST